METGEHIACCLDNMKTAPSNQETVTAVSEKRTRNRRPLEVADTSDPPQSATVTGSPIANGHPLRNGSCADNRSKIVSSSSWSIVPALPPTRNKEQVPMLFREPHVERGFRALNQPWSYYFWSVFQLHNESMNVWTHLTAMSLMAYKLYCFSSHIDFLHDHYSWPLLSGLLCGILLYLFSSLAHGLQSKSQLVHYVAFMIDYAGIGLYGLGSIILHLWYCSEPTFYNAVHKFFIPTGGILAFLIYYCCTVAKVIYARPYPFQRKIWQMLPVGGIYVVLVSPIVHRLWACWVDGVDCNESIPYHYYQMFWFIVSALFFASEFPQNMRSGLCDHFFHSHQLFHMAITVCTLYQMDAVFIDFQSRPDVFRSRPIPTFTSSFGPVISVLLAEFFCILIFTVQIKKKLDESPKVMFH